MENPTSSNLDGEVAVIQSINAPANALSHAMRSGLQTNLCAALENKRVKAVVVICKGRSFFAGADPRATSPVFWSQQARAAFPNFDSEERRKHFLPR